MLKLFRNYLKDRETRRDFFAFHAEALRNLEMYYVMFQLNRLRFFEMDSWEKVKDMRPWAPSVIEYGRRLTAYNQAQKDYKDYEQWYNEDLKNKNQENGRILHHKRELAQERFEGLEAVIKSALAGIDREFVQKGITISPAP